MIKSQGIVTVSGHATLPTSLEAYWKLEETSGTRLDETANNYDLPDNNTVLSGTGKQGTCADFEQSNSEWLGGGGTGLVTAIGSGDWSMSAWVNPESISGAQGTWGQGIIGNNNSEADGSFQVYVDTAGEILVGKFTGTDDQRVTSTAPLSTLATWYHVVVTYDSGGDAVTIYVDNSTVSHSSGGSPGTGWGTTGVVLGSQWGNGSAGYGWDGLIDEVGVWSKELSAAEVSTLYNGGDGIPYD
jgi:hypothetical protein